jgi:hypothetical protein
MMEAASSYKIYPSVIYMVSYPEDGFFITTLRTANFIKDTFYCKGGCLVFA